MPGYIGRSPGIQSVPSIPIQPETQAFLDRFTSTPSATFKNALNQAIYCWKRDGVYTKILDLWLTCADTQADSLRNLVTAARDATIVGTPTFTALKGFACGASNYLHLPFNSSVSGTAYKPFFGGQIDASGLSSAVVFGGGTTARSGVVRTYGSPPGWGMGGPGTGAFSSGSSEPGLCGCIGSYQVTASGNVPSSGASLSAASTSADTNSALVKRISTYGWLNSSASASEVRKFLSALQTMLEAIGALD